MRPTGRVPLCEFDPFIFYALFSGSFIVIIVIIRAIYFDGHIWHCDFSLEFLFVFMFLDFVMRRKCVCVHIGNIRCSFIRLCAERKKEKKLLSKKSPLSLLYLIRSTLTIKAFWLARRLKERNKRRSTTLRKINKKCFLFYWKETFIKNWSIIFLVVYLLSLLFTWRRFSLYDFFPYSHNANHFKLLFEMRMTRQISVRYSDALRALKCVLFWFLRESYKKYN